MTEFESLLAQHGAAVERFVKFRMDSRQDAEDILQETYLLAFQKFNTLRDHAQFKAWVLAIARNKCNDFYRSRRDEVPLEEVAHTLTASRYGPAEPLRETLSVLKDADADLIRLFYVYGYTLAEIGGRLGIPVGTVKSRLHTARAHLKAAYLPAKPIRKVDEHMKKFPDMMPEYTIRKLEGPPSPSSGKK